MESSLTLLSAHIQFLDTRLALIHIPLNLYGSFIQPILQLLLPLEATKNHESGRVRQSWAYEHPFVNISVTPIECSIACSRSLAHALFVPVVESLDPASRDQISISHDDYVVMQLDGEGLDAGQRVLELTSPLAMAGIPIFFITTYFSDYILVPLKSQPSVISALEERGFEFEQSASAYINPSNPSNARHRYTSSTSSAELLSPSTPNTPPPTTVSELQMRTFATLKRKDINPTVDESIRLVQCAGRKDTGRHGSTVLSSSSSNGTRRNSGTTAIEDKLHLGLVKCLISQPRFLSLTLTDSEPTSLLLEKRLLHHFDAAPGTTSSPGSVLLGSKEDILIPITLDLRTLPMESTGIVCGVAGRLVGGTSRQGISNTPVEMSYLSTAKAGTVMVSEDELDRAVGALKGMENGVSEEFA